ncbi:hypothetical protein SAMN03159423_2748 [Bradyrhizobium sp. NFR13]|jgi:hypothetical protein|uniref:hypothetical protein n=1 Tax=Bradyrhizobium sp. NFR13 TaxID=1566285 RepID=UPI0008F20DA4|nr:hypothetical protein [Bradyrhizobium sp. NFR13]SFL60106.1 hypothetical protein SAMN03159423_2748 [Bradyrhizobium sp. NFR13]
MRGAWTPSVVPNGDDQNVYLVVDGRRGGCVWREADVGKTDLDTVIADFFSGRYSAPDRVVAFNVTECWTKDVSADIARYIRQRAAVTCEDLPPGVKDFVERYAERERRSIVRPA